MQWGEKWPVPMNLPFFVVKAYVPGGGFQNPVPVQKNPRVRKFFVRNSGKCALSAGKTHVHKIRRFRGGGILGLGECRFYFYGRADFSDRYQNLFFLELDITGLCAECVYLKSQICSSGKGPPMAKHQPEREHMREGEPFFLGPGKAISVLSGANATPLVSRYTLDSGTPLTAVIVH